MPRYIDVERVPNDSFWEGLSDTEKSKVLAWFLGAPTADVKEVTHGDWQVEEYGNKKFIVCSVCNSVIDSSTTYIDENEFNYCPYCGCEMIRLANKGVNDK
jgi:predicted RNA-binding Zn-ribbon protein involved in translation (DUF1610 family)